MNGTHTKVVALNGSARKGGNTAILLRCVLKELEDEGIQTELIELSGAKIHGCLACRECSKNKDGRCAQKGDMGNALIEKMAEADGILLGSPTYVADISPEIKALMDRACLVSRANGGLFRRKVGAAVVAVRRAGAIHAFDALNHFFLISEMIIPGSSYWNIGIGLEIGRRGAGRGGHPNHENPGAEHGLAAEEDQSVAGEQNKPHYPHVPEEIILNRGAAFSGCSRQGGRGG